MSRQIYYLVKYRPFKKDGYGFREPAVRRADTYEDAVEFATKIGNGPDKEGWYAANVEIEKVTKINTTETIPLEKWNPVIQSIDKAMADMEQVDPDWLKEANHAKMMAEHDKAMGVIKYQVEFYIQPKEYYCKNENLRRGHQLVDFETEEDAFDFANRLIERTGCDYVDYLAPKYWFENVSVYKLYSEERKCIPMADWRIEHFAWVLPSDSDNPKRTDDSLMPTMIDLSTQLAETKANNEFLITELRKAYDEIKELKDELLANKMRQSFDESNRLKGEA